MMRGWYELQLAAIRCRDGLWIGEARRKARATELLERLKAEVLAAEHIGPMCEAEVGLHAKCHGITWPWPLVRPVGCDCSCHSK